MTDVVLVAPPFASPRFPLMGPSLIAAACRKRGISTHVWYANLDFAAMVGAECYERLCYSAPRQMAGESIFARQAFPQLPEPYLKPLSEDFPRDEPGSAFWEEVSQEEIRTCAHQSDAFLDRSVEYLLKMNPRILGFSSMFQQTMASLAIAGRMKKVCPKILTVFGGANACLPMGHAISEVSEAIDCVIAGEAEGLFPEFCQNNLGGLFSTIPEVIDCGFVRDLSETPAPEHDDYIEQLAKLQASGKLPESYPETFYFESSRGCWWGMKRHCRFCGMNGRAMAYRRKPKNQVVEEITSLSLRYPGIKLTAADSIMPKSLPQDVLPSLAKTGLDLDIHYETKADIGPGDLDMMVLAGVNTIQPGIESLSTPILKRIGKGIRSWQCIRLLREALSRRIKIAWNFLIGVPGERKKEYLALCELLPLLCHLQPPQYWGPIRIDRFSPYFDHPEKFGIRNVREPPLLHQLYPKGARVGDIAYRFLADWDTPFLDDPVLVERFGELIENWRRPWMGEKPEPPVLLGVMMRDGILLVQDTRPVAADSLVVLDQDTTAALRRLESPLPERQQGEIQKEILDELLSRRFVVLHEGCFLSLVTDPLKGRRLHLERHRTRARKRRIDRSRTDGDSQTLQLKE